MRPLQPLVADVLRARARVATSVNAARAGEVAFTAMEPTLSGIYWGVCRDRAASATLESALMFFQPRELLIAGDLSDAAMRLLKAFVATSGGCTLETVPAEGAAKTALLHVRPPPRPRTPSALAPCAVLMIRSRVRRRLARCARARTRARRRSKLRRRSSMMRCLPRY